MKFLDSMEKFRDLPRDTLVLPSHDWPFRGMMERLDHMIEHHHERLDVAQGACADPATAIDVMNNLFTRKLDNHQVFFAIGETLAHVHYLMRQGRVSRDLGADGVYRYTAA